ncbi:MAG: CHASE2 domain-containing protein [Alphaproteobacteria bacterium]
MRAAAVQAGTRARSRPAIFYLGLAGLFIAAILVTFIWSVALPGSNNTSQDLAVRLRLSSPMPAPDILIVDIDERALALLAPTHGRWPWPRSVIAETVANLSAAGAKSILVNMTFSDPDKDHREDDATFQDVLAHTPNVVLPITRLDATNDRLSRVAITRFAGAQIHDPAGAAKPIAVLAPAFSAVYGRLGFNNLPVDSDGVLRRFNPWLNEAAFSFPSLPLRALQAGGIQPGIAPGDFPGGMTLNWRNKRGDYQRRSFADVAADMDAGRTAAYRGKLIILGGTAVGLGSLKGTPAKALTDDNTILATAMDDMKSRSWLRTVPVWATSLLAVIAVLGLAASFIFRLDQGWINGLFWLSQTGFIAIMIYCASYTNWLLDISTTVVFATSYFAVANIYNRIHLSALRGNPAFSAFIQNHGRSPFLLVGVRSTAQDKHWLAAMVRRLERRFGVHHVLHVDNLFDKGHFLEQPTEGLSFMVIAIQDEQPAGARAAAETIAHECRLTPHMVDVPAAGEGYQDVLDIFRAILGLSGEMAGSA